jgi:hypothetical protein
MKQQESSASNPLPNLREDDVQKAGAFRRAAYQTYVAVEELRAPAEEAKSMLDEAKQAQ